MKRKNRFKEGLIFGILMAVFFILQDFLTKGNLTSKEIILSIIAGLIGGSISGILFGWLMKFFIKSKFFNQTTNIDTEPGETVLFETPANHFKGIEAVGGRLYLTDSRLIFKSHKLNIQTHQLSIKLNNIYTTNRYKTLGVIDNGLSIITKDNTTEKFVVEQADKWIEILQNQKLLAVND